MSAYNELKLVKQQYEKIVAVSDEESIPLFRAIEKRNEKLVRYIIDSLGVDINSVNRSGEHVLDWIYRKTRSTDDFYMMDRLQILENMGFNFAKHRSTAKGSLFYEAGSRGQIMQMQYYAKRNLFVKPEQEERINAFRKHLLRCNLYVPILEPLCDQSGLFTTLSPISKKQFLGLCEWLYVTRYRSFFDFGAQKVKLFTLSKNGTVEFQESKYDQKRYDLARTFISELYRSGSVVQSLLQLIDSFNEMKLKRFSEALKKDGWQLLREKIHCSELVPLISKRFHVDWLIQICRTISPFEFVDLIESSELRSYLFTKASDFLKW